MVEAYPSSTTMIPAVSQASMASTARSTMRAKVASTVSSENRSRAIWEKATSNSWRSPRSATAAFHHGPPGVHTRHH